MYCLGVSARAYGMKGHELLIAALELVLFRHEEVWNSHRAIMYGSVLTTTCLNYCIVVQDLAGLEHSWAKS